MKHMLYVCKVKKPNQFNNARETILILCMNSRLSIQPSG
jgi:hypothetical protein